MKKMMFAAVAAMAMVGAANAEPSYGIEASGYVNQYSLDANPDNTHASWYSCYVMKQADAQKAMGCVGTAVNYQAMAAWLGKNFADNKQSVINNAEQLSFVLWLPMPNQYMFSGKGGDEDEDSTLGNAIGVFFYDDDANVAYNVLANNSVDIFEFDSIFSNASGWTAVSVPEPTSGLLLLLGVAGLALKRKRV